ncbi:hypothetical protein Vadar_012897 [Vaccinium darrowii]|uniref:Uncharacterized protein n=1 Tax=Vaccinium darrowii TaxID=229202 RepID=A0ACB7XIB4_9ERIC|nr:hypothetical protein Vadar_012897 [Vaccinium darrowii]
MLGRVGRVVEAYEFVKELGEKGNNLRILESLLAACRKHGEFELGRTVANKLLQMERGKGLSGYHVLLSSIHAEEGHWEYVTEDHKHPCFDEIYKTLEQLALKLKDAGHRPGLGSEIGSISEFEE